MWEKSNVHRSIRANGTVHVTKSKSIFSGRRIGIYKVMNIIFDDIFKNIFFEMAQISL